MKGQTYQRYFELRYDPAMGERIIQGTALRYGDTATFPWGDKERFEPGAFGDLRGADVMLNFQHVRAKPLARTGGGGLEIINSGAELAIRADLPKTTEANDALELVRTKVMRGLSIEFKMEEYRIEGIKPGARRGDSAETVIVERAKLMGVAVVDRPQYPESKLRGEDMDEKEIQELIRAALEKGQQERGDAGFDLNKTVEALAPIIRQATADVLKERDDAKASEEQARQETTDAQQQAEVDVETRAELLTMVSGLLPTDFERRGKSNKEILVAACW